MYNFLSVTLIKKINISIKATPIYLLVLHAQEVGNEPFWNKKKSSKM